MLWEHRIHLEGFDLLRGLLLNFLSTVTNTSHLLSTCPISMSSLQSFLILVVWCSVFRGVMYRLRGTAIGANNRMDLLSLVTSGVNDEEGSSTEEDILGVVENWRDDETHNPDIPAVSHKRGMTPFVFVPFEEASNKKIALYIYPFVGFKSI